MESELNVDERIEWASTLPSAFYKDPGIYQRSIEAIFARSWQFALDLDEVRAPGTVHPITLLEGSLDEPIVVTRDMDDDLHVLANVCTHRGMQVVDGCGVHRSLRCRYHRRRI